ncbi:MAG: HD domain-containing protein [Deltaproteobacteria bacterium]|nr:HD domain-containing protein [Deltaproteobacteria bacterium]
MQSEKGLKRIKVTQLEPGMVIRSVVALSFDYSVLDPKTIEFLQKNLDGATAMLAGNSGERTASMKDLKPFDHLVGISNIPEGLPYFQFRPQLPAALEKQGFVEVEVAEGKGSGAPAIRMVDEATRKLAQARAAEAKAMMETVEKAVDHRHQSTNVVENMFDQGRKGAYTSSEVESMVGQIMAVGSSPAIKAISGLKGSDQTYAHCVDMAVILQECYGDIMKMIGKPLTPETRHFVLVAGFMHDIGKSEVPKEVLDSQQRFMPDSREMMIMRNHTTYGARILSQMGLNKTAINVAHFHHVKKDQTLYTSYPDVKYEEVLPLTRLAAVVDVYQALIGRRKYKKNWVPGKAIEYILKLSGSEFDDAVVDNFVRVMGHYPVGSLVRLSNNDLGFVVRLAPYEQPTHPLVAVVETAGGQRLTHAHLVDLLVEQDISVKEVVDHYAHFNASEDEAFNIFRSIQIS